MTHPSHNREKIEWNKPLSEAPMWFQKTVLGIELVLLLAILMYLVDLID